MDGRDVVCVMPTGERPLVWAVTSSDDGVL